MIFSVTVLAQDPDPTETPSSPPDSLSQQSKTDADSLGLNNSPLLDADSLMRNQITDSVRLDSPITSLPPPVYSFESKLKSIKKIDVPQRPLPDALSFSLLDSVAVDYVHINAIKRKFRYSMEPQPDSVDFFSITFPDTTVRSWAEIESYGQLIAEARLQKEFFFKSEEEFADYWETVKERMDKFIHVKIHVITRFPIVAQADTSTFKPTIITESENEIRAIELEKAPIKTNMWGMYTWYERDIIVTFPRYQGVQDIWEHAGLKLVISLNVAKQYAESEKRLFNFPLYKTFD